jgi:hypothetical protein
MNTMTISEQALLHDRVFRALQDVYADVLRFRLVMEPYCSAPVVSVSLATAVVSSGLALDALVVTCDPEDGEEKPKALTRTENALADCAIMLLTALILDDHDISLEEVKMVYTATPEDDVASVMLSASLAYSFYCEGRPWVGMAYQVLTHLVEMPGFDLRRAVRQRLAHAFHSTMAADPIVDPETLVQLVRSSMGHWHESEYEIGGYDVGTP